MEKTFVFLVAMIAAYAVEWLKNFLPAKVKENNGAMAGIAAVVSAIAAVCAVFLRAGINGTPVTWQTVVTFVGVVIFLTQACYQLLVKTFEAVKARLTNNIADPDEIAEDVAGMVLGTLLATAKRAEAAKENKEEHSNPTAEAADPGEEAKEKAE